MVTTDQNHRLFFQEIASIIGAENPDAISWVSLSTENNTLIFTNAATLDVVCYDTVHVGREDDTEQIFLLEKWQMDDIAKAIVKHYG